MRPAMRMLAMTLILVAATAAAAGELAPPPATPKRPVPSDVPGIDARDD